MNIKLTHKKIEEMCGTSSFKKGGSFYRANKVTFTKFTDAYCEATVSGKENFYVTVEMNVGKVVQTWCSCPALASVKKDCQHIAAVLLAIHDRQKQEQHVADAELANGMIAMLDRCTERPSGKQRHFENRQGLSVLFSVKQLTLDSGENMFGIALKLGTSDVWDIRTFLTAVREGVPYAASGYDPELHYFDTDTDAVVHELIQVVIDEHIYVHSKAESPNPLLFIPTSAWQRIMPLLTDVSNVNLEYGGHVYAGIRLAEDRLPMQFSVKEAKDSNGYLLEVTGFDRVSVFSAYNLVLYDGVILSLEQKDMKYLMDLKQMLQAAKTEPITIPQERFPLFMENMVPRLRRLGSVHLSNKVTNQVAKIPLQANLYLDRVKNRLLASVEFHYENIVIHPLSHQPIQTGSLIIRDVEKEDTILKLMEDSQFAVTDEGYFLHNEELEYEFLYHMLPKLHALVNVYATTAVRARVTKSAVPPRIKVKAQKDRINWLEFKFEMEGFPEQDIREVLAALEEKRKYYRLRDGSLLTLETKEFEEIQRFLKAVPTQDDDLEIGVHVPVTKGFQLLDAADDAVFTLEASFLQFLKRIQYPNPDRYPIPDALQSVLHDYQKHGFRWMKTLADYGFGGILADDMGLGKTIQSIAFIMAELDEIRKQQLPVLIVCPSSLTYNWLEELKRFTPEIRAGLIDGNRAARTQIQMNIMEKDVVIISYPLLRREINWFEKQVFHTVFFDEAQAFKNPVTQTARSVKKLQAYNRFALTGTPMENALEELWSIFHVVFPELFQGIKAYSNLTRKQISRRMRPFLLRRLKADVLNELPKKIEVSESVELFPAQKKLYAAYLAKLRHDTLKHLDRDTIRKNRIKILAGLTRLRQICCHPSLFVDGYKGTSAKFEQVKGLVEESRHAGRRVLIFSQFTIMLGLIGKELTVQGIPYFYLDGETPSAERVNRCHRFNSGERDFFLISMKAGGTGLNLTGADTVILYDMWWNPAVEEQAADRAHRIGQKNDVQVIKLISKGTIEEKMNALQEKKRDLIEQIIDPHDNKASSLTEEDIREILQL
ncbi:DEAD/DEAH box helicase [Virgibacillus salexigens]|uniref:DEAD/DEAH box helicase n=1 Tax=Virgibacillus salexigens TaxID=61016 RepID=UPI00308206A4